MNKKTENTTETNFQGPVSLDAIFAATSTTSKPIETKKIEKTIIDTIEEATVIEEKKKIEEKVETPLPIETPNIVAEETIAEIIPSVTTEGIETEAFKTAKKLIELGVLEDFTIQVSDEDEGTAISAFKDMTDDNLEEIMKIHKQEKENNISSNYIAKEGLKEHQLKVIEILQNGGDLSQIAESNEKAFERPFEGFDLEEQQRQVDVFYTDLTSGKSLDHDSAIVLINKEIKNGTLKETATKIFDLYRGAHSKYIDEKLEEQKKNKEFKDLNFKENKKALTAKLKEAGFKESVCKKVTLEYSKKNENGEYVLVDKLKEILSNPEENYELILHLTDKKLFNDTFKIKASQEAQKTIVRLASGVSAKGNRKSTRTQPQEVQAPWLKMAEIHNSNLKK